MTNIAENRKAFHDYFIEEQIEAGLVLEGWEVKAIREGRAQIKEAYVIVRDGALHLFGAHISPTIHMAGFTVAVPNRTRKLLLHKNEIEKLIGKVTLKGYTLVPVNLHFTNGRVKCQIGLAKGKKQHDKRNADKDRDAKREIDKAMKQNTR